MASWWLERRSCVVLTLQVYSTPRINRTWCKGLVFMVSFSYQASYKEFISALTCKRNPLRSLKTVKSWHYKELSRQPSTLTDDICRMDRHGLAICTHDPCPPSCHNDNLLNPHIYKVRGKHLVRFCYVSQWKKEGNKWTGRRRTICIQSIWKKRTPNYLWQFIVWCSRHGFQATALTTPDLMKVVFFSAW